MANLVGIQLIIEGVIINVINTDKKKGDKICVKFQPIQDTLKYYNIRNGQVQIQHVCNVYLNIIGIKTTTFRDEYGNHVHKCPKKGDHVKYTNAYLVPNEAYIYNTNHIKTLSATYPNIIKKRPTIVFIEANIGGGKTTFVRKLVEMGLMGVEILEEPVNEWIMTKDSNEINILQHYYTDKEKYSFAFQMNSFISRCEKLMTAMELPNVNIIIMERSVYSDYHCFAQNCYESGLMTEIEYIIYQKWFNWLTSSFSIECNKYIYIRTEAEECHRRIEKRARKEEDKIPIEYLRALHAKHDEWLLTNLDKSHILVLDGHCDFETDNKVFMEYTTKIKSFIGLQ
jgi:deoxyadenosine/deoxycytidine kinase